MIKSSKIILLSAMMVVPFQFAGDATKTTQITTPQAQIPPLCRFITRAQIPPPEEICDGKDNDCDGEIDEDFDMDIDGFTSCDPIYAGGGDCNDEDNLINPAATEICDDIDNNCDAQIDEDLMCTEVPSAPEELVGIFHSGTKISWINPENGIDTLANTVTSEPLNGTTALAYDNESNTGYIATGDGNDSLYALDIHTNTVSKIGAFSNTTSNEASNIQTLDVAPEAAAAKGFQAGKLYGVSIDSSSSGCGPNCLYMIDTITGKATRLGNIQANQIRGISFDPIAGTLWGYDAGGRNMYTITPNGQATMQFTLPAANQQEHTGINAAFSLAHGCDGTLYTVDMAYGVLERIDTTAHQAYWIGEFGSIQDSTGSFQLQGLDAVCN